MPWCFSLHNKPFLGFVDFTLESTVFKLNIPLFTFVVNSVIGPIFPLSSNFTIPSPGLWTCYMICCGQWEVATCNIRKGFKYKRALGWFLLHPWCLHEKNILWWAYDQRRVRNKWNSSTNLQPEVEASKPTKRYMRISNYFKKLNLWAICYTAIIDWQSVFLIYFHGILRRA